MHHTLRCLFLIGFVLLALGRSLPPTHSDPGLESEPTLSPGDHDSKDPTQCKTCKPALEKAMAYVKNNLKNSSLPGYVFGGLMYLIEGKNSPELKECVKYALRAYKNARDFNGGWYLGMSMFFLSEIQLRYPDDEIKKALIDSQDVAVKNQEPTGGWNHHLGFDKEVNYAKIGGGKDLGMVTSMIYGSFWSMKAAGITVQEDLFKKTEDNLKSISDGYGFAYGTANKWGDITMSRSSYVLLGLSNAKMESHSFYSKIPQGLEKRFKKIESGHAFAPVHHFSVAAAMHRIGKYNLFTDYWLDKLISRQDDKGSIHLKCDKGDKWRNSTADAAAFAIILLLQKDGAFPAADSKGKGSSTPPKK